MAENLLQDVASRATQYLDGVTQRRVFPSPAALRDAVEILCRAGGDVLQQVFRHYFASSARAPERMPESPKLPS